MGAGPLASICLVPRSPLLKLRAHFGKFDHCTLGCVQGWHAEVGGIMKEAIRLLHGDAGRADRTGRRALVMGRASKEVRSKKLHALLSSGIRCAAWARDGRLSRWMDTVARSCAMSNHGSCACAGMLLLPHSTRQHLRRVRARLAGARTTPRYLLHVVRRWRLRGCAAVVSLLLVVRE